MNNYGRGGRKKLEIMNQISLVFFMFYYDSDEDWAWSGGLEPSQRKKPHGFLIQGQ